MPTTVETSVLRVLVVDDMALYRRILSETLAGLPGVGPCETAHHGLAALDKLRARPADLVLLDVEMPEMNGLETLAAIRRDYPQTAVIMISATNRHSAATTIEALQNGAIDFIPKPDGGGPEQSIRELRRQLQPHVELLISRACLRQARLLPPTREPKAPSRPAPETPTETPSTYPAFHHCRAVVIASSTGGPVALGEVVPRLPADLPVPVLVVQHMPPMFTKSLAESLARKSALAVVEASEGRPIRAGEVLIAPGGRHMTIRKGADGTPAVGLTDAPPENGCRPAADVLFRSAAAHYTQGGVLAAVMTGMGRDGCEGVRALKRRGCFCLSQSQQTCVVYGMPQAVDERGLSDERVDLADLASRIAALAKEDRRGS